MININDSNRIAATELTKLTDGITCMYKANNRIMAIPQLSVSVYPVTQQDYFI